MSPTPRGSTALRLRLEAGFLLVASEVAVRALPFRLLAPALGRLQRDATSSVRREACDSVRHVRWAVITTARRVPTRPRCLAQAITARIMLRRRSVPATLHLGLRRRAGAGEIVAHAWLLSGGVPVVGGDGAKLVEMGRFA